MTEKLYYNDPYLKEWQAEIIDIIEDKGKFLVILDRTAFYPEGGGQPSDRGFINNIEVSEVFEKDNNIYHVTADKPEVQKVSCRLDFERRYYLMQQHTGQHLLSSVFYESYGGETSSFHLGEDYVSIDISLADMEESIVKAVEAKTNELIYQNLEVKRYMVTKEELGSLPLRKFPKVEEDIRIIEINKIDYSPCCGTHVSRTGELGLVKIVKTEKYKGVTRVYFKCGKSAFEDYQNKQDTTVKLCKLLAVDYETLIPKVQSNVEELKGSLKEIKELKEKLNAYEVKEILKTASPDKIVMKFEDKSFEDVQSLGRILLQSGDYLVILSSIPDKKLWLAHNGNFSIHCGKTFKENLQAYGGRGGGGDKQAQASFETEENLINFENFLKESI
jgi:alanyl-tRNA synthetase